MKRILLLLIFFITALAFPAEITWSGHKDLISDFIVDTLDILTIEPGTTIRFDMETKLIVYGEIRSNGTSDSRVTFTYLPGIEASNTWGGIIIDSRSSENIFSYTDISNMTPLFQSGYAGMSLKNTTVTIENCSFTNNSGDTNGGAIKIEGGIVSISNTNFNNNYASDGGAIKITGFLTDPVFINIDKCVFESNTADSNGGAVYVFDDYMSLNTMELNITSSDFFNNVAMTGNGGAVYYMNEGHIDAEFSKCRFFSNDASWGSAIYASLMTMMSGIIPPQRFANLIVLKNTGGTQSGIYLNMGMTSNPSDLKITNLTVAFNSIKPSKLKLNFVSGIYINSNGNYPLIENNILWKNTDQMSLPSNYWIEDLTYPALSDIFKYCDIQNDSIGVTNLSSDPLFINPPPNSEMETFDPDKYDLHESVLSPCSDTGDPALTDPDGSRLNIGAYGGTAEAAKPYFFITDDFNIPDNTAGILEVIGGSASIDSIRLGANSQMFIKSDQISEVTVRSLSSPESKFSGMCSIEPLRVKNSVELNPHRITVTEKLKLKNTKLYNISMRVSTPGMPVSVEMDSMVYVSDSKSLFPAGIEVTDPDVLVIENSKLIGKMITGIKVAGTFKNAFSDPKTSKRISNNTIGFDADTASKLLKSDGKTGIEVSNITADIENNVIKGADIGVCMKSGSGGRITNNAVNFDVDTATKDTPYYKTGIYVENSAQPVDISLNNIVSRDYLSTNITGIEIRGSEGNIMYNTIYPDPWYSGKMRAGIKIMDASDTVNVVNNTICNSDEGFFTHYSSVPAPANIINNIYWSEQIDFSTIIGTSNVNFFNNCLIDTSNVSGSGNISNYPDFVSSGDGNFNLNSSSPCINAGIVIDGIHSFSEGKTVYYYGTAPDIGSHEFYQKYEFPQNVLTSVSELGLTLSWDALNGYNTYKIFASDSPYSGFTCIASTWDLTYTVPLDSALKFFYIQASTDWKTLLPADKPGKLIRSRRLK
ncbi:MAG TPA: hypothetical protein PLK90_08910 [Clostridiales bacterium]|nr:hypothetical protein [Clostridiales bacterium]HQP70504.1 hypothetical protein [Clostridiales bacterium]